MLFWIIHWCLTLKTFRVSFVNSPFPMMTAPSVVILLLLLKDVMARISFWALFRTKIFYYTKIQRLKKPQHTITLMTNICELYLKEFEKWHLGLIIWWRKKIPNAPPLGRGWQTLLVWLTQLWGLNIHWEKWTPKQREAITSPDSQKWLSVAEITNHPLWM